MESVPGLIVGYSERLGEVTQNPRWATLVAQLKGQEALRISADSPNARSCLQFLQDLQARQDLVQQAIQLILDPKWIDQIMSRKSFSIIEELKIARNSILMKSSLGREDDQRQIEDAVSSLEAAPLNEFVSLAIQLLEDQSAAACQTYVLAALIHLIQPTTKGLSPEKKSVLIESLKKITLAPWVEKGSGGEGPVHPFENQRLTFGAYPEKGQAEADTVPLYDVSLPGSRTVDYNILALLKGVSGTATSGLSYNLVHELDTIKYGAADRPKERAAAAAPDFLRVDSRGDHPRPMTSSQGHSLDQILEGPAPDLDAYQRLAEVAAFDPAEGFALENTEEFLEKFSEEIQEDLPSQYALAAFEVKRRGAELEVVRQNLARLAQLREKDPGVEETDLVSTAFSELSSGIVASRALETEKLLAMRLGRTSLPGSAKSQDREVSLTMFLQASKMEEQLEKAWKLAPESELWRPGRTSSDLLAQRLAGEECMVPTLKLASFWLAKATQPDV